MAGVLQSVRSCINRMRDKLQDVLECIYEIRLARKLQKLGAWDKLLWEMDQLTELDRLLK